MTFELFSSFSVSIMALLFGALFGFLLRKGGVARFDTIVSQLLLKDFTVMKVMFTAIVVGSFGIYLSQYFGLLPSFHLSTTPLIWAVFGGAVFGVGMSLAGYCPGTAFAALAEGAKDVYFVVLGLLAGAVVFNIGGIYFGGKSEPDSFLQVTLPDLFSASPFTVIAVLAFIWVLFAITVSRIEKRS